MKVALKFKQNGNSFEHALNVGEIIAIGRSSKCEFQLEDEKISGRHCRFFLKSDRLELTDLGSKNGTYLNGIRVESSEIFMGDQIKIGDTIISLEERSADEEAIKVLSFPGNPKDRAGYELKMDFTGVRIQNQINEKKIKKSSKLQYDPSHAKEIELRKKANSRLKLPKEEIKANHQFKALVSSIFDLALLGLFLYVPYHFQNLIPGKEHKTVALIVVEIFAAAIFLGVNFKSSKFSFGETISGIKKIYLDQEQ